MPESLLRARLGHHGSSTILVVTGKLDVASGPSLEHTVARVLDGQGGDVQLDLSALTFMDSTGARSLVRVYQRFESLGRRVVLVSPTPPVRRVIELLGLDQLIEVEE